MLKKILEELKKDRFLMALLATFFIFLILYLMSWGLVNTVLKDRAVLGLKINGISVSGQSKEDIEKMLTDKTEAYKKEKLVVEVGQNKYEAVIGDFEPDYKVEEVARRAIAHGKNTYDIRDFSSGIIIVTPSINEEKYQAFFKTIADKENTPYIDASVDLTKKELTFTDEKEGEGVDGEKLKKDIINALTEFRNSIKANREILKPKVTKKMLESAKIEVEAFIEKPLTLKAEKISEKVPKETLLKWLGFTEVDGKANLIINKDAVSEYLKLFSKKIDIVPKNAVLTIKDGKVVVSVASVDGKVLDEEKSLKEIEETALETKEVVLPVKPSRAEVREDNLDEIGINGLVSTGTSNFTGSPTNRKHNIRIGASKYNSVLIKPDEIFSFNKYLGDVDAANGYLPELVILENKTELQYGGGLCQVSSTAFRAALNAGMPIYARKSHAYPVKYYYPIGTDATIYIPSPDLKFKNNTGTYVLIQTSITGNILKFDFYGTKPKGTVKFSGSENGEGAVLRVEDVSPYIFNQDLRGRGSLDSIFYRFIYDEKGKLIDKYKNLSKYDSPDKYPHPATTQ